MPSMSTEIHTLEAGRFGTAAMVGELLARCVAVELGLRRRSPMVEAPSSGGGPRKRVRVRVPPSAQRSPKAMAGPVILPDAPLAFEHRNVWARIHRAKQ